MEENKKQIKSCNICDYHTNNITDYNKHLKTKKHKVRNIMLLNGEEIFTDNFICKCGKKYMHLCSLSKHRHNCLIYKDFIEKVKNNTFIVETTNIKIENNEENLLDKKYTENFEKNNKEIINTDINEENIVLSINEKIENTMNYAKNAIVGENENSINKDILFKIFEQHNELKSLLEKIANTSNITNNTIINNNNFNLHIFLNEKCKNAMSINDFIDSLKIDSNNVEYTGINGYVEGITKIFIDGLSQLDVYERPIHCTDIKRETLYIKENSQWEKDNNENEKLKKAINTVVKKNMQQVKTWKDKNPNYDIIDTKEYELHFHIMQQSLGGGNQEKTDKNNLKIIKNIARHVYLDKKKL